MNVTCPGCSTRYALEPHLLGPSGARICCPACRLTFVLGPAGELAAVLGHTAEAPPVPVARVDARAQANGDPAPDVLPAEPADAAIPGSGPLELPCDAPALEVLRALDEPPGTLAAAAASGRLFADHGAELLTAFESLRQALPGAGIDAEFREALYEMTGVDLVIPAAPSDPRGSS